MARPRRDPDEEALRLARWRRDWLHRRRKHVADVLEQLARHWSGDQLLTPESYREHREWAGRYFVLEAAHEVDVQLNLPHLRLVSTQEEMAGEQ